MVDIIKTLKSNATLYYWHSHNKYHYVRVFLSNEYGLKEITHEISDILGMKKAGMFLIGPKGDPAVEITDKLNRKCDKLLCYEDMG